MSGLRMTLDDLAAFHERRRQWEETGQVRTHTIKDDRATKKIRVPRRSLTRPSAGVQLRLSERQVLRACLNALQAHPKVLFAWRQNVGVMKQKSRTIRFAFKGCSDLVGCLEGGRWLAVECKATGEKATDAQQAFLDRVNEAGGLGVCVDDAADLVEALNAA